MVFCLARMEGEAYQQDVIGNVSRGRLEMKDE